MLNENMLDNLDNLETSIMTTFELFSDFFLLPHLNQSNRNNFFQNNSILKESRKLNLFGIRVSCASCRKFNKLSAEITCEIARINHKKNGK